MRSRQRTTVADVMTTAVVSVPPHAPVPEVASTLFAAAVRAVPVVSDEGDLLGVISEADLMATIAATEPVERRRWRPRHVHRGVPVARPGARTAGDLMSAVLVTIDPGATVAAAARLMREQGVNWLPVVADSQLVGVLGRSDLLAVFLRSDAAIRTEIVEDVLVGALATDPSRVAVDVVDGVVTLTLVHRPADGDEWVVERPIADHADGFRMLFAELGHPAAGAGPRRGGRAHPRLAAQLGLGVLTERITGRRRGRAMDRSPVHESRWSLSGRHPGDEHRSRPEERACLRPKGRPSAIARR
jgi:CBS domain-containing protein